MAGTVIKQARDTLGAQVQRDDHRGTKSKWGDCLQAEGGSQREPVLQAP